MAKYQSQLLGSNAKICVAYCIFNANIVKGINDLQQKYANVKSLRRSGWTSNILLYKILGWK